MTQHAARDAGDVPALKRTPPKRKARELAKHLRGEHPDYAYLKAVFQRSPRRARRRGSARAQAAALRPDRARDPPLLRHRLASTTRTGHRAHQDAAVHGRARVRARRDPPHRRRPRRLPHPRSPRARAPRTATSRSPAPSRRRSRCTSTTSAPSTRSSSSSPAGRSPTAPAASARCSPATPNKPA